MKQISSKIITMTGAALLLGGLNAVADDNCGCLYVHADLGAAFVQNLTLNAGGEKGTAEFDPGARFDASIGYNIANSWAVEFETGELWNRMDKFAGQTITGGHVDLFQTPLLANVIYKINLNNHWTPYLGAGVGGNVATLDSEPDFGSGASDTDIAFAFQGQAGISYAISENASVDLGYKFFGSLHHNWNLNGETLGSDNVYTHSVLASFSWKF